MMGCAVVSVLSGGVAVSFNVEVVGVVPARGGGAGTRHMGLLARIQTILIQTIHFNSSIGQWLDGASLCGGE